jgi:hypothetical protein
MGIQFGNERLIMSMIDEYSIYYGNTLIGPYNLPTSPTRQKDWDCKR